MGEEIPVGARIISVADSFDAMTSKRPFRGSVSQADALKILDEKSWSQFDGRVVKAFREVVH